MKGKEWFGQLKNQGKISSEDFDKFLETVPEFEIPDNAIKAFEDKFMTPDRAVSHPDVNRKLKADLLSPISRDIEKILGVIGKVDSETAKQISRLTKSVGEGREIPDTYRQIEALNNALPTVFDKLKVAPNEEESKKQIEELKRTNEEFTTKFQKATADYQKQIEETKKAAESELTNYKLSAVLEKKANSYTFADVYKDTRPTITKAILGELRSKNHLGYAVKDGDEMIEVFDLENGVPRPKFNGNTPVTAEMLLDEAFKPFLKVNGKTEEPDPQARTQSFRVDNNQQNSQTRQGGRVSAQV